MTPGMPQPPRIRLPQVAQIDCAQCKNNINVILPRPRLANAPDVSILTFVHERLSKCPHCGVEYLFQIHGVTEQGAIEFIWIPVQPQQEIIPGTQANLSQALNTTEIAGKIKLN